MRDQLGGLTGYVLEATAPLPYEDDDPRRGIVVTLLRLAARWDTQPRPGLAVLISRMLMFVTAHSGEPANPLEAIKCRSLLGEAGVWLGPVTVGAASDDGPWDD